jgi:hypothetical protein
MVIRTIATTPSDSATSDIYPSSVTVTSSIDETTRCSLEFETDYTQFSDEASPDNPVQLNAQIEITRDGDTVFNGYVFDKTLNQNERGEQTLEAAAMGIENKANSTLAYIDDYLFVESSPYIDITQEQILNVEIGGDAAYWYWPVSSSAAWLPTSGSDETNNTTTDASTTHGTGATQILATVDNEGMAPRGLLYIHTGTPEIVSYDGYYNTGAGNKYIFDNVVRGQLGTTAQSIPGGTKVSQFVSQLHYAGTVFLEGYNVDDSRWEALPAGYYTIQPFEGAFTFSFDILALEDEDTSAPKFNDLRATYRVFDELDPATIQLDDILTSVWTASKAVGGLGFTSPDIDLGDVRLTRIYNKKGITVRDFTRKILNETSLVNDQVQDPAGYWYDYKNDVMRIKKIVQKTTPDFQFDTATDITQDISLQDVYSAALVQYRLGLDFNLLGPTRCWHPDIGDALGSNTVDEFWRLEEPTQGTNLGWEHDNGGGSNNWGTYRMFDSIDTTGWGIGTDGASGADAKVLWAWFEGGADYLLDELNITFDFSLRVSESFNVQVFAVTSFNTGTPTSSTGLIPIPGAFIAYDAGVSGVKDSTSLTSVPMNVRDIGITCQGIVIQFNEMPRDLVSWRHALIKEVRATGSPTKATWVKISNSPSDSTDVYAPNQIDKLLSTVSGYEQHRSQILEIGTASRAMAISLGRYAVEQALVLTQIKTYSVTGYFDEIPNIGDTVEFIDDDFKGVVISWTYRFFNGGEEELIMDVIDYESELI